MTTPEGRVKQNIRRILDEFDVYYLMPVQMGKGAAGVDFHCVVKQAFVIDGSLRELPIAFFIEAKKSGEKPTPRQAAFLQDRMEQQNCMTFVIDDDPSINHVTGGLNRLYVWLEDIGVSNERARARFPVTDVPVSA